MRTILAATGLVLLLGACSGDEPSSPQASGAEDGTSLSIDTEEGSVSYENEDGGSSTSISVGEGDDSGN